MSMRLYLCTLVNVYDYNDKSYKVINFTIEETQNGKYAFIYFRYSMFYFKNMLNFQKDKTPKKLETNQKFHLFKQDPSSFIK